MKISLICYLALSFLLFHSPLAHCQGYVYATGNQALSTQIPIENGFINVNNGELHIEIPLAVHQQRGRLQLKERLVYDSRIWQIINNSGYSWQPTNVPGAMGGWNFFSGTESGTYTYNNYGSSYVCNATGAGMLPYNDYYNFRWTDPTGAEHQFSSTHTQYYNSTQLPVKCLSYSGNPVAEIPNSTGYASDGSGYYAVVSNYTALTVYDQQGNQYTPTLLDTIQKQATPQVTDTNGNYWSQDASGNLVDSLGRKPVQVSTSGNQTYYDVLGFEGHPNRYTVTTQTVYYNTAFKQSAVGDTSGSFTAIQSIALPDGSAYSFTYDSGTAAGYYGELTSVTLPTGGVVQYTYSNFLDSFKNQNRWLHTRVRDGGTTTLTPSAISQCSSTAGCQEKTVVTSPQGDDTVYTFTLDSGGLENAASWNTGVDLYQGSSTSGGTKLRSINTAYTYSTSAYDVLELGTNNTVIGNYEVPTSITTATILPDSGVTSNVVEALDYTYARPASVKLWDYYSSSGSVPSAPTTQTIYTYDSYFPMLTTVEDGAGNQISQTSYGYDETIGAGHAVLTKTSGLPNHNPVSAARLNLTTISQWLNTSTTPLSWEATYDDAGSMLTSTDPNGTTTYGYDTTDTFANLITPPTPSSGIALPSNAMYDASTGLLLSQTDPNGAKTSYMSYDWNGRPTEIDYPDGGKMTATYAPTQTGAVHSINAGTSTNTQTQYDGYGRTSRIAIGNGQSTNPYYQTDTCYDVDGRESFQSQQYQGAGWGAAKVCSGAGDLIMYDALNRVKTVTHADGSAINYNYTGRATEIIDENNAARIVQTDALGRTSAVCEIWSAKIMPGAACGLDYAGTGYLTNYTYSLANHMTTVVQGSQTRTFQADSVGRSVAVSEPESGLTSYTYAYSTSPVVGLTVARTRPQANQTGSATTTTTTQFDTLGREVSVNYSDGLTPNRLFAYDVDINWPQPSTNLKGRLASTGGGAGSTWNGAAYSYDIMGRLGILWQCAPATCGTSNQPSRALTFAYDWVGNLTLETDYASGAIAYGRSIAGEVTSITNQTFTTPPYNPPNLVSSVVNGPNGPISYTQGNGLNVLLVYDPLGRLRDRFVCNGPATSSCIGGIQVYGTDGGWMGSRSTGQADTALNQRVSFGYDALNRLTSRTVSYGTAQNYTYSYDRYGNRMSQTPLNGGYSFNPAINPANNRITTSGYTYDAAGNMTNDSVNAYTYDAEGNVIKVVNAGGTSQYVYDVFNQRVHVQTPSGTTEYIYDYAGRRISSWVSNNSGNEGRIYWDGQLLGYRADDGSMYFEHQDLLGTERLRTSYNGTAGSTYASLPWGDGYTAAVNSSGADQDNNHFAGLERDPESNTEHALFRNYASAQGRWLSPDPYPGSYDFTNPQSFNRYSYVGNNPIGLVDPSGQDGVSLGGLSGLGGCVGAGASGGTNVLADAGCGFAAFKLIWGLFDGPSFHGTLQPRPSGGWDGNFGESLGIPTSIPQGNWGIGLSSGGCEFGACGAGPSSFGPGGPGGGPNPISVTSEAVSGGVILPFFFGLVGPALSVSYDPKNHLLCGGVGVGVSAGHTAGGGPVVVHAKPGNTSGDVLSGWSLSGGYNWTPWWGYQGSVGSSGYTAGYSFGVPGASGAVTYSWCRQGGG